MLAITLIKTSVGRWSVASISIFNFFVVFCMFLETDFFHVYPRTLMKEDSAIYGQRYACYQSFGGSENHVPYSKN